MRWEWQRATPRLANDRALAVAILKAFREGFQLPAGWSIEGVQKGLARTSIVGLLYDSDTTNRRLVGYAMYTTPSARIRSSVLVWEDAICVLDECRGRGLTRVSDILEQLRDFAGLQGVRWFGGRTQNPLVLLRYQSFGRLLPFDYEYDSTIGQEVLSFLVENVTEVSTPLRSGDDRRFLARTGIVRKVYSEGRLGDYASAETLSRSLGAERAGAVTRYESSLKQRGFDRESGDAVICVAGRDWEESREP